MHRHRACSAALASGLAGLLATTAFVSPAAAQAPQPAPAADQPVTPAQPPAATPPPLPAPPPQPGGAVQRVVGPGNDRMKSTTVIPSLPISPGEMVDAAKLDAGIKALARTDLFSDEKIEFNNGDLVVTVVENPIINRVLFEGNSSI